MTSSSHRSFASDEDVIQMAHAFFDKTLPLDQWRHREHCAVTLYLLLQRPGIDPEKVLPDLIREYVAATGGQNTATSGYHHTMTLFFIQSIRAFKDGLPPGLSLSAACNLLLQSPVADKSFALRHYSKDRLYSDEARARWVAPDLG